MKDIMLCGMLWKRWQDSNIIRKQMLWGIEYFTMGRNIFVDVSVAHTVSPSSVVQSAKNALSAVSLMFRLILIYNDHLDL